VIWADHNYLYALYSVVLLGVTLNYITVYLAVISDLSSNLHKTGGYMSNFCFFGELE